MTIYNLDALQRDLFPLLFLGLFFFVLNFGYVECLKAQINPSMDSLLSGGSPIGDTQSIPLSAGIRHLSPTGVVAASFIPVTVTGGALYENATSFWMLAHRSAFHFSNDPPYSLHNDQLGHAWFTAVSGDVIRRAYVLAGVDSASAIWLGSGLSLTDQFIVEVIDGFHDRDVRYGFSLEDFGADLFGASFQILQFYSPFMRRLDYKASLWPSEVEHLYKNIFDDDESAFFWFSCSVPEVLPAWLNITAGYSVENLSVVAFARPPGARPASQGYLGFDINLKGLPFHGEVWDIVSGLLSHYRIPFPAIMLTPRIKWCWLR